MRNYLPVRIAQSRLASACTNSRIDSGTFALVITVIMLGIYRYTAEAAEYMRQNHRELAARDAEIERLKREWAKAVHERH